jgi:CcmD family protein
VSSGDRFVFAAYLVVLVTVLAYLLIIALKVSRLDRELGDLARRARDKRAAEEQDDREKATVG